MYAEKEVSLIRLDTGALSGTEQRCTAFLVHAILQPAEMLLAELYVRNAIKIRNRFRLFSGFLKTVATRLEHPSLPVLKFVLTKCLLDYAEMVSP